MPKIEWQDDYYYKLYALAAAGYSTQAIAEAVGIDHGTLLKWQKEHPALERAIAEGHRTSTGLATKLPEYIFARLSPELQLIWDDILLVWNEANGHIKIEKALEGKGKRERQHLFLYALAATTYSASKACVMLNISKATLDYWSQDPDFHELWNEIEWHKKNFCEDKLMELVNAGWPAAVIMVNKTLNADRGYGNKLQVTGNIQHTHVTVDLGRLNLPDEVMDTVVQAMLNGPGVAEDGLVLEQDGTQPQIVATGGSKPATSKKDRQVRDILNSVGLN